MERINSAKARLAYEVTKLVHGEQKAEECRAQAKAAFSGDSANMPTVEIDKSLTFIPEIMVEAKIVPSRGEARRLIDGGGVMVNDQKLTKNDLQLPEDIIEKGEFVLHKGKKVHIRIILK